MLLRYFTYIDFVNTNTGLPLVDFDVSDIKAPE